MKESPQQVYNREGSEYGLTTGAEYPCRLEGCRGWRLGVLWPDGRRTYPCTRGLFVRPDGNLQLR